MTPDELIQRIKELEWELCKIYRVISVDAIPVPIKETKQQILKRCGRKKE